MKNNSKIITNPDQSKRRLRILLARPRGFCAGVDRAVRIVEEAISLYGAPIYVRHEIVHNAHVVRRLAAMGAVFVETLSEIPHHEETGKTTKKTKYVIFSAHGAAPDIAAEAKSLGLHILDATCPLVSKVHAEVRRHVRAGRHIFLIGHQGHPEITGTIGHIHPGAYTLIENIEDAQKAQLPAGTKTATKTAYATQTTLSVSETAAIIRLLKERFPGIAAPNGADICYATTNRQNAVAAIAPQCDWVFIIGAQNSSNACRLVETARAHGAKNAQLINDESGIPWHEISSRQTIGLSAGASTPEFLVDNAIAAMQERFHVDLTESEAAEENIIFRSPSELRR